MLAFFDGSACYKLKFNGCVIPGLSACQHRSSSLEPSLLLDWSTDCRNQPRMSMFKTAQSMRNVVTLFHDPKILKSERLANLIHKKYSDRQETKFDVDITTAPPTAQQLATLRGIAKLPVDITPKTLPRPTLVSWFNGQAAVDDESAAKKILSDLQEGDQGA